MHMYTRQSTKYSHTHVLETAVFAHRQRAVVGMRPGAVPIARHWLGVEADDDAKLFGNALQQEATHPQVITHLNALARTDLYGKETCTCRMHIYLFLHLNESISRGF